jgi:hypothetical protein
VARVGCVIEKVGAAVRRGDSGVIEGGNEAAIFWDVRLVVAGRLEAVEKIVIAGLPLHIAIIVTTIVIITARTCPILVENLVEECLQQIGGIRPATIRGWRSSREVVLELLSGTSKGLGSSLATIPLA